MKRPELVSDPPKVIDVSVIVPCYNEAEIIRDTVGELAGVLRAEELSFEIVAVDDGSKDPTTEILEGLTPDFPELRPITHMRNFGQTAAYQTGLEYASGQKVILFSGDLEIPAEQILRVVDALERYDFVNTERDARWGGLHALKSHIANTLLNRISKLDIEDRGSGLKGMRSEVAKSLHLYGEWHRFLPDLASLYTSRITELKVPFEDRKTGVSSYRGSFKSVSVILDLATVIFTLLSQRKPYALLPGRLFGFAGLIVGSFGFVVASWLVLQKLLFQATLADRPLFLVSLLLAVLGLIMVMLGTLGELLMQIATRLERATSKKIRPPSH